MNRIRLIASGAAVAALFYGAPAWAQTFPPDGAWQPVTAGGVPLGDPLGDAAGQPSMDIVGDKDHPAAFVYKDTQFLYFRLRVDGDPIQTPPDNFRPFAWGVEFVTGNCDKYDYLAMVEGITDTVQLYQNTTQATSGNPKDPAETLLNQWPTSTHARSVQANSNFGGNPDFFVDWAVDIADLTAAGVSLNQPIDFIFGTSTNKNVLDTDLLSPTNETTICALSSDPVACSGANCAVGCTSNTGCTDPARPACQPDGSCAQCSASTPCTGGQVCNTASGLCGSQCQSDANCNDPAKPACVNGVCSECSGANTTACPTNRPVCDAATGTCIGTSTGAGGAASGGTTGTGGAAAAGGAAANPSGELTVNGGGCAMSGRAGDLATGALFGIGALAFGLKRRRRRRR